MIRFRRSRDCPTDGELRWMLEPDGPVDGRLMVHLEGCQRCSDRLAGLRTDAELARQALATFDGIGHEVDVSRAYSRLREKAGRRPGVDLVESGGNRVIDFWGRRSVRAATGLAALIVMVAAFSFTPMRTVAEDLLRQMRVQKFAAVTIPMDMVEPFQSAMLENMAGTDPNQLHDELARLGTFETTFNYDKEHLPQPVTLDEALQTYGAFDVPTHLPDGFNPEPQVYVTEAGTASYTLNVERAQQLIDQLGIPFYSLPDPAEHPTLTFTATFPAAAVQEYTNAEQQRIIVGEMQSPELVLPDGIDMDRVREDILRFPALPPDLVAQLREIDDWEHTLIIPIPEGARSDNVTIHGVPALLIEDERGSAILWEKDGILHAVVGQVPADEIREIARSLHEAR